MNLILTYTWYLLILNKRKDKEVNKDYLYKILNSLVFPRNLQP